MPIYEYQCQECKHLFDALQKINENPLLDCPSCGEDALKRLISAPNFRLKGKGWYETDFKKENQKNLADSKEDKPSKAEDKDVKKKSDQPEKKKASKDKAPKDKE
ncbi:zinc ribbon domain-containing protein [Gammaproteobacteria bacterium]|nr:zinc ribbon domain-containing protein [Gammaproteobacteria bacterium]